MVVKESLHVLEENTNFQDSYEDEEEKEEALSLCDLPIHNDSFKWEDESFSKLDHERSPSFGKDDYFEFFSEDFTASNYPSGKDIIFCGKIIPYKEPPLLPDHHHHHQQQQQQQQTQNDHHHHHHHHRHQTGNKRSKNKRFQWKSYSFHKLLIRSSSKDGENYNCSKPKKVLKNSKTFSLPNNKSSNKNFVYQKSKSDLSLSLPNNKSLNKNFVYKTSKSDLSLRKVSVLSTPTKSRWYLFTFGIARLPTEMELRDIKTRQSRRSPSATMFSSFEESRGDHHEEIVKEKVVRRKRRRQGLWGLIRALSCGSSSYTNAVVNGSFGYDVPEVRERI